jgi:putative transposase
MNNNFKLQPPRLIEDYSEYFLTFNTFKRKEFLTNKDIPVMLINSFNFLSRRVNVNLDSYVVMPDHIHLLISCKRGKDIPIFLRRLKSFTSREIKERMGLSDYVWQRGTFDHVIRDSNDYEDHFDYIHFNPVKHRYVSKPEDWKWSSFKYYLRKKYYQIGWGHEIVDFKSKNKYSWGE